MKKIIFVIDTLQGGGAARVTTIIANELVKNNFKVVIATNLAYQSVLYNLNTDIKLLSFYRKDDRRKSAVVKILRHAYYLRKVLKKELPDIIIGEQEGGILYSFLAKVFMGIPMIGHRHNTFKILGLSTIYKIIYKMPDKTILLHNEDVKYVKGKINNVRAIYNPHTFPLVKNLTKPRSNQVICVGSVDRWYNKGLDTMIKIWSKISFYFDDWKLIIVGGGSDTAFSFLRNLVKEGNCKDSVIFMGAVNNVDELLRESAIFALPSRVEGFPMVLNEAISQGCPSIAFELNGVIKEIYSERSICQIPDGDMEEFGKELKKLMECENLRYEYSVAAREETTRYLPENIVKDWIKIIDETINN